MEGFVCRHGIPEELHTDQGGNFESELLKEMCSLLSIQKPRTTPRKPQSDGMGERFNRTIIQQLALFTADCQDDWDEHLPYLLMAYRTSQYGATTCRPALLMYGWELRAPVDLLYGLTSERPDGPPGKGYARQLEEGMEKVHAFAHRQLQQAGVKMKRRSDHRSQASEYPPGTKI